MRERARYELPTLHAEDALDIVRGALAAHYRVRPGYPDGWARLTKDLRGALVRAAEEARRAPTTKEKTTMSEPSYEDDRDATPPPPTDALAKRPETAPVIRVEAPPRPAAQEKAPVPGPRTSDLTDELFRVIAEASLEFGEVKKARYNTHFKSKYANLTDVMRAIGPALAKHKLVPIQIPMGNRVYVRLVHGPSGQWIEGVLPLVLPDHGADIQRLGSALTYLRRYLLTMLLGIVADDEDDDDGSAAMPQRRAS